MKFTNQIGLKYMGHIQKAYISYSADKEIRNGAASGGVVSALLIHLLETNQIDGAIVTKAKCSDDGIDTEVALALNRDDILAARTSKYIDVPLVRQTRSLLKNFHGKVAVVALPCHATILKKLMQKDPQLASKIKYIIALFCGHSCDKYLLNAVLKKESVEPTDVVDFAFRKGLWRGNMQGKLKNGLEFSFPFNHFSVYHNLNFFCLRKCLSCHDHTGYDADFCAGDAWLREMKKNPIKHTILLSRNQNSTAVLDEMVNSNKLIGKKIDNETVFRSQKRGFIYHYNTTARAKVGKSYGLKIKDKVNANVRLNDWLAAHIIMINYKLSNSRKYRDLIFKIPKPVITIYFLFLKFLQNF